jgi:hypothetical protein
MLLEKLFQDVHKSLSEKRGSCTTTILIAGKRAQEASEPLNKSLLRSNIPAGAKALCFPAIFGTTKVVP